MKKEECLEIFERYMQNAASDEEIKNLSNWIRSSKEISGWLEQQILTSSADIDKVVQMHMFENIKAGIADSNDDLTFVESNKIMFQVKKWMRVAALFVLPMLTAAGMYLYFSRTESSAAPLVIAVERGHKASITLPDGSKAWLNSESKLTYSAGYNKFNRELQLEGEAYFEVAHNPKKPFIVKSKDMAVEALGTVFEVKVYPDDNLISSVLMKGKVRVTTAGGVVILTPNQRILYNKKTNQLDKQNVVRSGDFAGWINNELRFEDESLQEIAKCIQRIYDVKIIFADENSKNYHFTGTVPNDSLEGVLDMITITSPVIFQMNKNQITIHKKN
jgi:ferric-dicitrate binding protein FerR (iron transport regulator)